MRTFDIITTEYIDFKTEKQARDYYKRKSAKNGEYKIKRQGETLRGHTGHLYDDFIPNKYEEGCCLIYKTEWGWTLKLSIHYER